MKNLHEIWSEQYSLQQLWHSWPTLTPPERDALTKDLLLHIHEEVAVLQRILDQSRYHLLKQRDQANVTNIAEKGVDVFKLLVALLQLGGATASDFETAWQHVSERVKAKWNWEQDQMSEAEVLLCDIDGVIAKYADAFRAFAESQGHRIGEHINTPELEPVKDLFQSTGGFLNLEPIPGAIRILNNWQAQQPNRRLVLVTARPYKRYRRIYTDTIYWCKKVLLNFDHILFEHDKAEAVRLVQPAKIIAHIEDRGKHALEVAHTGTTVYKLPFEAPEEQIAHPNIKAVRDWHEISQYLGVTAYLGVI